MARNFQWEVLAPFLPKFLAMMLLLAGNVLSQVDLFKPSPFPLYCDNNKHPVLLPQCTLENIWKGIRRDPRHKYCLVEL